MHSAPLLTLATIGRRTLLAHAERRHAAELAHAQYADRGYLDEVRHADQRLAALRRACGVVPPPAPHAPKLVSVEVYIDFGDSVPEAWGESQVPAGWRPYTPYHADADGVVRQLVPVPQSRDVGAAAVAAVEAELRRLDIDAEVVEAVHVVEFPEDRKWLQGLRRTRVEVRP